MYDKWRFIAIFSGVWALIGIVFFIIGTSIRRNRKKKERICTSQTYGKVVDLVRRESRDSDGNYSASWHPVFEYHIGGSTFLKESNFGRSQAKFAIGQIVDIYYDPENPNQFYVPEETLPNTLGTIFAAVGIVAILVAVTVAFVVMRFIP